MKLKNLKVNIVEKYNKNRIKFKQFFRRSILVTTFLSSSVAGFAEKYVMSDTLYIKYPSDNNYTLDFPDYAVSARIRFLFLPSINIYRPTVIPKENAPFRDKITFSSASIFEVNGPNSLKCDTTIYEGYDTIKVTLMFSYIGRAENDTSFAKVVGNLEVDHKKGQSPTTVNEEKNNESFKNIALNEFTLSKFFEKGGKALYFYNIKGQFLAKITSSNQSEISSLADGYYYVVFEDKNSRKEPQRLVLLRTNK
ncbi:MAG: hypothetical protein QXV83_03720 [Candidatus Anstonellaceae archaeon]